MASKNGAERKIESRREKKDRHAQSYNFSISPSPVYADTDVTLKEKTEKEKGKKKIIEKKYKTALHISVNLSKPSQSN